VATTEIPGYTYGSVERSPVTLDELAALKAAAGFDDERDGANLRRLGEALSDELFAVLEKWFEHMGPYFMPTVSDAQGRPIEAYLGRAHPRLAQWFRDTCERPYDQEWLDYQQEIGLRHTRAKKNQTDGVESTDHVPYRWLAVSIWPVTQALRPFLANKGLSRDEIDALIDSWMKSMLLQLSLWSRAYIGDTEW
jgi:hypothetical protein